MRPPATVANDEELLANTTCLRRLARQLVGRDEADDFVQDTWAATFAHRPGADRPVRLWLLEVMRNFARMRRRRQRLVDARYDRIAAEAVPSGPASADQLLERLEVSRVLVEQLSRLPEPYRATALLRYFDNRSAAEIARLHGVPAGTVRWRLKRALDLLREELDSRFGGDRRAWVIALGPFSRVDGGTLETLGPLLQGGLAVTAKSKVLIATGAAIILLLSGALVWRTQRAPNASRLGDVEAAGAGRGQAGWVVRADEGAPPPGTGSRHGGLAVEVVDTQGAPVVGAKLSLARGLGASGFELSDLPRPLAVGASDDGGRFRFGELAAGTYTLTATREGLLSGSKDGIAVDGGGTRAVRLTLGPGGLSLSGRILDSASGVIAGARVTAQLTERDGETGAPPRFYSVTSSTDGAYALVLGPGRYTLRAEADGYAVATDYVVLGAAITKNLAMEAAASLSGRVVDRRSKQPVAGVTVQARLVEGWNLGRSKPATTDDGGRFHLVGLGPGDFVVDVRSDRLAGRSKSVRLAPGQGQDGILVELDAGHSVDWTGGRRRRRTGERGHGRAERGRWGSTVSGRIGRERLVPVRRPVAGPVRNHRADAGWPPGPRSAHAERCGRIGGAAGPGSPDCRRGPGAGFRPDGPSTERGWPPSPNRRAWAGLADPPPRPRRPPTAASGSRGSKRAR